MSMNDMQKWEKSIEASRRKIQKRNDVKDLRNAGIYNNGVSAYLDEDGYPLDGVEIPHWFKNFSKAWKTNKRLGAQRRREKLNTIESTRTITDEWNDWCDDKVQMLGEECDPRNHKPKLGRPKLPAHLKKNPTKIKRSNQMRLLLQEHGITANEDSTIVNYDGWTFCLNGRIKFEDEPTISTYEFIKLYG